MATTMEIVTFNCQGLRSSDHRETLFSWLNCTDVDFLCLQETHSVSQREFSSWLHDAMEAKVLSKPYDCVSSPALHEKPRIPRRIRMNTACNISRIPIFQKHIARLLVIFRAEYFGIRHTKYSCIRISRNTVYLKTI